ncbi:hypothetical protein LTS08_006820 [Lithohypha guttulata]|nr:hypothetical protein LTS08_006820 [Lithohypha guttulata]
MSIKEVPLVSAYRAVAESATRTEADKILAQVRSIRASSDETPASHSASVETAFREQLIELIASINIEEDDFSPVWSLLDALNLLCDNELCDFPVGFYLVEDLLDSQTINGCRKVFNYLESRRERMTKLNFHPKQQTILRCCNELLRRLSRAEDTVFCGRVFIYLFQSFQLGDKSSINLRGEFHTENVTIFDDIAPSGEGAREADARNGEVNKSIDLHTLYPTFWALQNLFSSPTRLFQAQSMFQFKDAIQQTLTTFVQVSKDAPVSTSTDPEKRGTKRKIDDLNGAHSTLNSSAFNPKYLTNRDLFDLEIHDIQFRRHFLVQSLIILDFLLALSTQSKTKLATEYTQKSIIATLYGKFTLSEDDRLWCIGTRKDIERCLESDGNGTEGRMFLRMVNMVLSRDKNWVRWKVDNCPAISKPPVTQDVSEHSQHELLKLNRKANAPLSKPKGSDQLAFLSQSESLDSMKNMRHEPPTLEKYYNDIQTLELDLDFATEDEKKDIEEQMAGKLWRALRSAKGRRFVLCEEIKNGENLGALVGKSKEEPVSETNGEHVEGIPDEEGKGMQQDEIDTRPENEVVAGEAGPSSANPEPDPVKQEA